MGLKIKNSNYKKEKRIKKKRKGKKNQKLHRTTKAQCRGRGL